MDLKEFELSVIRKSHELPVLVDFWAPWCGPCQVIGPVLEELSAEAQGRWQLVKVNVDESQELAAKYGIRGIPNMKLFIDGTVAAEQSGALPKYQMEKWLNDQIPDPRSSELTALLQRVEKSEKDAIDELVTFVEKNPDFDEAKVYLAEQLVFKDPEQAKKLSEEVSDKAGYLDRLSGINDLSELISSNFEEHGAVSEKLTLVQRSLKKGEMEKAIEELIETVRINKSFARELPRRSVIALFNILGPSHELTRSHRRKFDMALY